MQPQLMVSESQRCPQILENERERIIVHRETMEPPKSCQNKNIAPLQMAENAESEAILS